MYKANNVQSHLTFCFSDVHERSREDDPRQRATAPVRGCSGALLHEITSKKYFMLLLSQLSRRRIVSCCRTPHDSEAHTDVCPFNNNPMPSTILLHLSIYIYKTFHYQQS